MFWGCQHTTGTHHHGDWECALVCKQYVSRISNAYTHKAQQELWVEWKGYDQSQNCLVHCDILMTDVPALVKMFDDRSLSFKVRATVPKRATKGYKTPVRGQVLLRRGARRVPGSN